MSNMYLSIIIPTYNEEKDILDCLNSLASQSYKNFEIIIVDDGSTDKTLEIVKNFPKKKVRILKQKHCGPGLARNLGAEKSKGEILIFIDADMTFEKNYLKNLIEPIQKDKEKKVIGATHELEIVNNTKNIWSKCWGKIRVSKEDAKDVKVFRAIRKNKFLELGGFDPKYGYADDQTLWFKHRIGPVVAKNTVCYHKNPETLKGVYKQSRWIGSSHDNFWMKIPFLNLLGIFLAIFLSFFFIIFLSIRKSLKIKNFIIFPYMVIFMSARYFGSIEGYIRKILWNKNFK